MELINFEQLPVHFWVLRSQNFQKFVQLRTARQFYYGTYFFHFNQRSPHMTEATLKGDQGGNLYFQCNVIQSTGELQLSSWHKLTSLLRALRPQPQPHLWGNIELAIIPPSSVQKTKLPPPPSINFFRPLIWTQHRSW